MKKVSTAAAKQSKNFSQQKLTIGLDERVPILFFCSRRVALFLDFS